MTGTASPAKNDGPGTRRGQAVRFVVALVASFLLGNLTFHAQGLLPEAFSSFANSSSGWTLLTALLVAWSRARPAPAAALGASSFVLLVLGYTAAAYLGGLAYNPLLFSVVAVVAGPFVGIAVAWLRSPCSRRTALGTALLAGIGVGESIYGLTVISASTSPIYWVMIGVAGLVVLATSIGRIRNTGNVLLAVAGTAVIATTFVLAYVSLGYVSL